MNFILHIEEERCKGCVLCVKACPKDVLAMSKRHNSRGFHVVDIKAATACIGCKQCADICPDAAIEIFGYGSSQKRREKSTS